MSRDAVAVTILVDRRPTNLRVREKGQQPFFPDVVMCVEQHSGMILSANLTPPEEGDGAIQQAVAEAAEALQRDRPGAAVTLLVRQDFVAAALHTPPPGSAVRMGRSAEFAAWDQAYLSMEQRMGGGGMLPYLWHGDISADEVAEFFAAAAAVYQAQPWRFFTDAEPLEVPDPLSKHKRLIVAIMGALGVAPGIAIFSSPKHYEQVALEEGKATGLFVGYEPRGKVPHTVIAEAQRHRWPTVNKSAFPIMMRVRDGQPVAASGDDVRRACAALRAVERLTQVYRRSLS